MSIKVVGQSKFYTKFGVFIAVTDKIVTNISGGQ